jgi:hypothetical protein
MKGGESNKAPGFGVDYKATVSVRSDKIGSHADEASKQSSTIAAFNSASKDTKKA